MCARGCHACPHAWWQSPQAWAGAELALSCVQLQLRHGATWSYIPHDGVAAPAPRAWLDPGGSRVEACTAHDSGRCAGNEDPWVKAWWARRVKRQAPSIEYYSISPAGHCPHDECPDTINTLVEEWIAAKVQASCLLHQQQCCESSVCYI
jgi:pimeloyl-ACP methyl ester carboxylesterase